MNLNTFSRDDFLIILKNRCNCLRRRRRYRFPRCWCGCSQLRNAARCRGVTGLHGEGSVFIIRSSFGALINSKTWLQFSSLWQSQWCVSESCPENKAFKHKMNCEINETPVLWPIISEVTQCKNSGQHAFVSTRLGPWNVMHFCISV